MTQVILIFFVFLGGVNKKQSSRLVQASKPQFNERK